MHKTMRICFVVLMIFGYATFADDEMTASISKQLPPLETLIIEPIELEHISVWIPAGKAGPFINQSCRPKTNCVYSFVLPATVNPTIGVASVTTRPLKPICSLSKLLINSGANVAGLIS